MDCTGCKPKPHKDYTDCTPQRTGSPRHKGCQFVDGKPIVNTWKSMKEIPVSTKESDVMSKDLKERGFKFVGSTICYAHMQATGMVNDHVVDCFRYKELSKSLSYPGRIKL